MKNLIYTQMWGGMHNIVPLCSILLLVACCLLYRYKRSMRVLDYLIGHQTRMHLLLNFSRAHLRIKLILFFMATVCIGSALLMPRWGEKDEQVMQEKRDVMIALDISRSMLTQDCSPNRLTCAKKKILVLMNYLACERIGLMLFSGSAFVQCPLTTDYNAFKLFLDVVDVETIASGSTAIDQAIAQTLRMYQACPDRRNKLLILITDGEDFSHNLKGVQEQAARIGMHIFALGIGTAEGGPIPLYNNQGKQEGYQKDDKGSVVISRLHEPLIRSLVGAIGGNYISMTHDDSDVRSIAQKISTFEKEQLDGTNIASLHEQYHYFIAVGLALFVLEWFL